MYRQIKTFLLLIALITALPLEAQKLTVESMALSVNDAMGNQPENLIQDLNGDYGGLVKVYLAASGATFEGLVLRQQQHNASEYWVVMAKGSRSLKVVVSGYLPLKVDFRDYGIRGVESRRTYELTVLAEAINGSTNVLESSTSRNPDASKETFTVNGVQFTMVRVEGGTFKMGTDESDTDGSDSPAHEVTLSSYMIGETEVTQALWQAVMGSNPSSFTGDQTLPVEQVSWDDCQKFVKKLNSLTGKSFRLPTEAEWEYAARGGNKSRGYEYSGSNKINDVAWYLETSGDKPLNGDNEWKKILDNNCKPHPVAKKSPNELGLYDMSGNLWEWCSDLYGEYSSSAQTNPKGATNDSYHVLRGGCWISFPEESSSTFRSDGASDESSYFLGLRLAL